MRPLNSKNWKGLRFLAAIFLPLVLIIIFNDKSPIIQFKQYYLYAGLWYFSIFAYLFFENEGKYQSPQALFYGGHMSIAREPLIYGKWAIFTDGIKAHILPFLDLRSCAVIVPKAYVRKIGEYYVTSVKIKKKELNHLSREPIDALNSFGINTKNVWYGEVGGHLSVEQQETYADYEQQIIELKDRLNRAINYARGNLKDWSNTAADLTGVMKSVNPNKKNILDHLRSKINTEEKEKD